MVINTTSKFIKVWNFDLKIFSIYGRGDWCYEIPLIFIFIGCNNYGYLKEHMLTLLFSLVVTPKPRLEKSVLKLPILNQLLRLDQSASDRSCHLLSLNKKHKLSFCEALKNNETYNVTWVVDVMQTSTLFQKQYWNQNYLHVHVVIINSSKGVHVFGIS